MQPEKILHSVKDLELYGNTLSATSNNISSFHSTFWNLGKIKGYQLA